VSKVGKQNYLQSQLGSVGGERRLANDGWRMTTGDRRLKARGSGALAAFSPCAVAGQPIFTARPASTASP